MAHPQHRLLLLLLLHPRALDQSEQASTVCEEDLGRVVDFQDGEDDAAEYGIDEQSVNVNVDAVASVQMEGKEETFD